MLTENLQNEATSAIDAVHSQRGRTKKLPDQTEVARKYYSDIYRPNVVICVHVHCTKADIPKSLTLLFIIIKWDAGLVLQQIKNIFYHTINVVHGMSVKNMYCS